MDIMANLLNCIRIFANQNQKVGFSSSWLMVYQGTSCRTFGRGKNFYINAY